MDGDAFDGDLDWRGMERKRTVEEDAGVDVRLMEHAEHDDADEMNASLVVVGS